MVERKPEAEHPLDGQITALISEYERIVTFPPGDDSYISSFAQAMVDSLSGNSELRNLVRYGLGLRKSKDIEHTAHVIRVSLQRQLQHEQGYPFASAEEWSHAIREIIECGPPSLVADMAWRNIQTNVPERYKSLVLTLPFLRSETLTGPGPRLVGLDVGTSHMQGPKKLAYMHKYPFLPVDVVEIVDDQCEEYAPSRQKKARINRLLKKKPKIGQWVGLDLWPIRDNYELQWDIENDEWIRTCSFRLAEVAEDSEKLRDFDKLAKERVPRGFSYRDMDFSVPGATVTDNNGNPMLFDFVFCSTSVYQAEPGDQRAKLLENGERHLKPDGLLIVQDSVRVDETAPNGLRFYGFKGDVPEYTYTTLVKDMAEPEAGFQEIWRWYDSRCPSLLIDIGALCVSGQFSRRVAKHLSS